MELKSLWLVRFRFVVVIGQSLILLAAWILKSHQVSIIPIVLIIGTEVATNIALMCFSGACLVKTHAFFGLILTADVLLLTLILMCSGGAMNPYTIFYLVEVAAVAVLLEARWAWSCVLLCVICYGSLFLLPHAPSMPGMPGMADPEFRLHLYGMLTSFVIAATCVAYFITHIQRDRVKARGELVTAQQRAYQMQRFTALTAVAAGAAHELATPLGTIAIAASELRQHATLSLLPKNIAEDIELIESQVQRCREILNHLDPAWTGDHGFQRLTAQEIFGRLVEPLAEPCRETFENILYR